MSPPEETASAHAIVSRIRTGGKAVVALSGGVDSSLVAALAFEALGPDATAITLDGPSVSRAEVARARQVAEAIGIEHVVLPVDQLSRKEYRENGWDRCYHCRAVETSVLREFADPRGARQYLDGVQSDDMNDVRPGLRAMDEAGFRHPLLWGRWGKAEVRAEARRRGLPNWDQPSDACLASRVAHGEPVTSEVLARIESAEKALLRRGFRRVRVRVRGGSARIEVGSDELPRLLSEPLASEVVQEVGEIGFRTVTIDPRGYHGGPGTLPVIP